MVEEPTPEDVERRLMEASFLAQPSPTDPGRTTVGEHYQLEKELGRGGQAVVYRARDRRLNRVVALKVLNVFGATPDVLARFRREAATASKLDHPGICTIFDAGVDDGVPWIAMRYIAGTTLGQRLAEARAAQGAAISTGATPTADDADAQPRAIDATIADRASVGSEAAITATTRMIEKIARALHYAHEAGVVHRDIKPANIMLDAASEPSILDFGLAQDDEDGALLTRTGDLFGTPAYMSPEQLLAQRVPLDRRTDVYSLGVTLYEALTLRRPFEAPTRQALFAAVIGKDPPDPRRYNRGISPDLRVVIETAIEKDRDRRYQTALDLAEDLRRVVEGKPILARPVSVVGRVWRWARRHRARAALAAVIILAVPVITAMGGYILAVRPDVEARREEQRLATIEGHLEAGYTELAFGSAEKAREQFQIVLAEVPDSAEAMFGIVRSHAEGSNDLATATALLDGWAKSRPLSAGLRRYQADLLRRRGRESEARAIEAATGPPVTAVDWYVAGLQIANRQRADLRTSTQEAIDALHQSILLAKAPRAITYMALADSAATARDKTLCRQIATALLDRWPRSAEAVLWAGFALTRVNLDEALVMLEHARELGADPAVVDFNAGTALAQNGRVAEALPKLLATAEARPGDGRAWANLAKAFLDLKRPADALPASERAISATSANDPLAGRMHFLRGSLLQELGRLPEATTEFELASKLCPDLQAPWINLGNILSRSGRPDGAIAAMRHAADLTKDTFEPRYNLGALLEEDGLIDDAIREYRAALAINPQSAEVMCNLGLALAKVGRFDESLELIQAGHALGSQRPNWSYPSKKWVESARRSLELARRVDALAAPASAPSTPADRCDLARCALAKGEPALALRLLRQAFDDDPTLADGPPGGLAARAAVRAAAASRADSAPAAAERRAFREFAREHLVARLAAAEKRIAQDSKNAANTRQQLRSWLLMPDFSTVRDPSDLARLPDDERASWSTLWSAIRRACGPLESGAAPAAESR